MQRHPLGLMAELIGRGFQMSTKGNTADSLIQKIASQKTLGTR